MSTTNSYFPTPSSTSRTNKQLTVINVYGSDDIEGEKKAEKDGFPGRLGLPCSHHGELTAVRMLCVPLSLLALHGFLNLAHWSRTRYLP